MPAPGGVSPQPSGNRLLARLPRAEYQRLRPRLETVSLAFRQVLYEPGEPIRRVYFPTRAVASVLAVMRDGTSVEVTSVGSEGMVGLPALLGAGAIPNRVITQIPGEALCVSADALQNWAGRGGVLGQRVSRYISAFLAQVSQGVACNGMHTVRQRCCRWLLETHDRVGADVLPLTHEFLSIMLGVRRATVSEVLQPVQSRGLIHSRRGRITVLDRAGLESASCECHRVIRAEYDRLLG